MDKYKAIPDGYMTVGEIAKKMGVSVRTLQYYDKQGLLTPSAVSQGGRRLYNDKDVIELYQIVSMKQLGFSLEDIKKRLLALDNPTDVANALAEHAATLQKNIEMLCASLKAVEALKAEVQQMHAVDFKKYADIITNLQMKNQFYWLVKYFDDQTLEQFRIRFDAQGSMAIIEVSERLSNEAIQFQKMGVSPQSEEGQRLAKEYWDMLMEFTDGDMSMLPKLSQLGNIDGPDAGWKQRQEAANLFIEPALGAYFEKLGLNPFEEGADELRHTN